MENLKRYDLKYSAAHMDSSLAAHPSGEWCQFDDAAAFVATLTESAKRVEEWNEALESSVENLRVDADYHRQLICDLAQALLQMKAFYLRQYEHGNARCFVCNAPWEGHVKGIKHDEKCAIDKASKFYDTLPNWAKGNKEEQCKD